MTAPRCWSISCIYFELFIRLEIPMHKLLVFYCNIFDNQPQEYTISPRHLGTVHGFLFSMMPIPITF